MGKFIDCGFHGINSLRSSVASVGSRGLYIGINHVIGKAVRLRMAVKSDRFMAAQSHGCRTVFPVSAAVGKSINIQGPDNSILISSRSHPDLHLVAGRPADLGFVPAEKDLGRPAGLPGDKRRIDLADRGLLRAEAAADPGLDHADFGRRDIQGRTQNPSHMKRDLCGGHYIQAAEIIHIAVCAECFHHRLLVRFCVICLIHSICAL